MFNRFWQYLVKTNRQTDGGFSGAFFLTLFEIFIVGLAVGLFWGLAVGLLVALLCGLLVGFLVGREVVGGGGLQFGLSLTAFVSLVGILGAFFSVYPLQILGVLLIITLFWLKFRHKNPVNGQEKGG